MSFPDELLRGISHQDKIIEDDTVTSDVFYFHLQTSDEIPEGCWELSVNWWDDEGSLDQLFTQRKSDGNLQFKGGAAVLSRKGVDDVRHLPVMRRRLALAYERQPLPDNKYHGNLLLKNESKKTMKVVAAAIALCVTSVLRNPTPKP
ncbi:MAG: hypothetical protein ABIH46_01695 [Chloroflexota bacterium]